MRLLLVAGFLGSGKTTLIPSLARRTAAKQSVAVIVNEVGEVGIDGSVLKSGDLDQGFQPHLIVVEASGIAAPAGVLDASPGCRRRMRGRGGHGDRPPQVPPLRR